MQCSIHAISALSTYRMGFFVAYYLKCPTSPATAIERFPAKFLPSYYLACKFPPALDFGMSIQLSMVDVQFYFELHSNTINYTSRISPAGATSAHYVKYRYVLLSQGKSDLVLKSLSILDCNRQQRQVAISR